MLPPMAVPTARSAVGRTANGRPTSSSVEEFLTLVVSRERRILQALFAGDDSLLGEQPVPRPETSEVSPGTSLPGTKTPTDGIEA